MNNTLVKGLQFLKALARARGPVGVSELPNQLALGKSHMHRLLQDLVALRYAARDENNISHVML